MTTEEKLIIAAQFDAERFNQYVYPDPNSGCFIWAGATTPTTGYGCFWAGSRTTGIWVCVSAHRYAIYLAGGRVPDGLWVLHKCDTRCCVNVDHLFFGTCKDNNRDSATKMRRRKGRLPFGVIARPGGTFGARCWGGKRTTYHGTYATIEEAHEAAMKARDAQQAAFARGEDAPDAWRRGPYKPRRKRETS